MRSSAGPERAAARHSAGIGEALLSGLTMPTMEHDGTLTEGVQVLFLVKDNPAVIDNAANAKFRVGGDEARALSDSPEALLRVTTEHAPKDAAQGFLFGRDPDACDVLLDSPAADESQFAVQVDWRRSALVLKNTACQGTRVRLSQTGVSVLVKSRLNLGDYGPVEIDLGEDMRFALCRRPLPLPPLPSLARHASNVSRQSLYQRGPLLHQGTKAQLFLAREPDTGQRLAMKVYPRPEQTGWQEAKILERLQHPNIVQFHTYKTSSHSPGELLMELADGPTLEQTLLARDAPELFSPEGIRDVLHQLLEAVAHMEARGVAHRNLQASNVIVVRQNPPLVKLVDFAEATSSKRRVNSFSGDSAKNQDTMDVCAVGVIACQLFGIEDRGCEEFLDTHRASSLAADLLYQLLYEQLSARRALDHAYFASFRPTASASKETPDPSLPIRNLRGGYQRLELHGKPVVYFPRNHSLNVTHLAAAMSVSRQQLRQYFKTHPDVPRTRVWWRLNASGIFMSIDGEAIPSLCQHLGLNVPEIRHFLAELSQIT